MIEKQFIKFNNQPIAVVLDFEEYSRMLDFIEDKIDAAAFIAAEKETTSYRPLEDFLAELNLKENR